MSKYNRDTSLKVAFANRDYYAAASQENSGYVGLAPWTEEDGQDEELNLLWQLMKAKKITYPIVSMYVDGNNSSIKLGSWDQIGIANN